MYKQLSAILVNVTWPQNVTWLQSQRTKLTVCEIHAELNITKYTKSVAVYYKEVAEWITYQSAEVPKYYNLSCILCLTMIVSALAMCNYIYTC